MLNRRRNTGRTARETKRRDVRCHERTAKKYPFVMVKAILMTNFVAIHTTTMTLTSSMLTKHQEYIQPLRKEIKIVGAAEGWSKSSVREMWKLDTHEPKSVEGLHFSNGMTNLAGSILNLPIHTQVSMALGLKRRSQEGEEHKHELVTTGVDYIVFSHGRHGCPGRFFIKVLLARVLLKNDCQDGGWTGCSLEQQFETVTGPNMSAKVVFRKQEA
ncbi:hypothetical protein M378DRAFT_15326 [Amanita muscaria Koide BX008]|uniref:Cytochrome P450 n=1 Tax=Amanita muscaria (strain Koide BX008) TaxID=946122 RepID=A0A0C2S7E4_AMAMK|nr:hypothetical protein M378DRAFT_15326 [Amanita muscaria Koide BX008]